MATNNDILKLNVGGTNFVTRRSTLCAIEGTLMEQMFRSDSNFAPPSEVEGDGDGGGEVFLDRDPTAFPYILNYLRDGFTLVTVPEDKGTLLRLRADADYFGLEGLVHDCDCELHKYLHPTTFRVTDMEVVHGSAEVNTVITEKSFSFSLDLDDSDEDIDQVLLKPVITSTEDGVYWKVTLDKIEISEHVAIGIIDLGVTNRSNRDNEEDCVYMWSHDSEEPTVYRNEDNNVSLRNELDRCNDFNQDVDELFSEGDCLYFCLRSNMLTLYNVQKDIRVSMPAPTKVGNGNKYCMYFRFHCQDGGKVKFTIAPLFQSEEKVDYFV